MKMRMKSLMLVALLSLLAGCSAVSTQALIATYDQRDYLSTRTLSDQLIAEGRENRLVLTLNGWSRYQLGDYDGAAQMFAEIRRLNPNAFQGHLGGAWIAMKRQDWAGAEQALEQAGRWVRPHEQTMLEASQGWLAFYRNDLEQAEALFRLSERSLMSDNFSLYLSIDSATRRNWWTMPKVGLGCVAFQRGQLDDAEVLFREGINTDPGCHLCYAGLAAVSAKNGIYMLAIEFAARGLEVSSHDYALVEQLNGLLAYVNDADISRGIYERLVVRSNGNPLYLANLGHLLYRQGDRDSARHAFNMSLSREPGQPLALAGLDLLRSQP